MRPHRDESAFIPRSAASRARLRDGPAAHSGTGRRVCDSKARCPPPCPYSAHAEPGNRSGEPSACALSRRESRKDAPAGYRQRVGDGPYQSLSPFLILRPDSAQGRMPAPNSRCRGGHAALCFARKGWLRSRYCSRKSSPHRFFPALHLDSPPSGRGGMAKKAYDYIPTRE